jgi:methionyl-tRNA synthetase
MGAVIPSLERLDFRSAAEASLQLAIAANGYLNTQAPWSLMKKEGNRDQVAADLYAVLEAARWVALLLGPLVPELSARMLEQLAQEPLASGPGQTNGSPWLEQLHWGQLAPGAPLPEPAPVMARLELDSPL